MSLYIKQRGFCLLPDFGEMFLASYGNLTSELGTGREGGFGGGGVEGRCSSERELLICGGES